jgi:hypothetical protein
MLIFVTDWMDWVKFPVWDSSTTLLPLPSGLATFLLTRTLQVA